MDYQGARVENEAVIVMSRGFSVPKQLIFDEPFRIMIKEQEQSLPYLFLEVQNTKIMESLA